MVKESQVEIGIGALTGAIATGVSRRHDVRRPHKFCLDKDVHLYISAYQSEEYYKILS